MAPTSAAMTIFWWLAQRAAPPYLCYAIMNSRTRRTAMAQPQRIKPLESADPIWERIRSEAEIVARQEPQLASFIYASLLGHDALDGAVIQRISDRLDHPVMTGTTIRQAFLDAVADDPGIGEAFRADIVATYDRDPATTRFI